MGLWKTIVGPVLNEAKDQVVNTLGGGPSRNTIIVVCDGGTAETAAENIVHYLDAQGQDACLMKAGHYYKHRQELVNNRVVIIGHHDLAKEQLANVNIWTSDPACSRFGLICGTSYKKCVLRAVRKALSEGKKDRKAFARYYQEKMSEYADFAELYAVPRTCEARKEIRESQYDLLWTIFANEVLPRFLGRERETPSGQDGGPGSPPGPAEDKSGRLLEQFLREAPRALCVTGESLRQLYERQLVFTAPSSARCEEGEGKTLLERGGWRISQDPARDRFCLQERGASRCVTGTAERILSPVLAGIHAQAQIRRMKETGRLDYGIVFCGGGAKGAFQLGVWKWLEEHGGTERYTGVSGASVGAMNTLLFARGDYERAEQVWLGMRQEDLLRRNAQLAKNLEACLPGAPEHPDLLEIADALLGDFQENAGLFSKEALERIIRENISLDRLRNKLAYVSLSAFKAPGRQKIEGLSSIFAAEYAFLDAWSPDPMEYVIRRVLASAALPGAYTPESVDGVLCIDGGVLDNSPYTPLVQAGYRKILIVHLTPRKPDRGDAADVKALEDVPALGQNGAELWHVWPSAGLGGTLEIDPALTRQRIDAGYAAASESLKNFG
jgi:NTE family protein